MDYWSGMRDLNPHGRPLDSKSSASASSAKPGLTYLSYNIKLEKAMITKQNMQYLYNTGDTYYFMNMETYEQIELTKDQMGDDAKYLIENLSVNITFYEGEMLGMELPEKIEYTVTKTEPAVKGNTTNNALKEAYMENDLMVKVPLFIEQGEKIVVSTKDGKYDSRA